MTKRHKFSVAAITAAAALLGAPGAMAQDDPTAVGGGKKAYVLVIVDSSGSMEWTEAGDNTYPTYDTDLDGVADAVIPNSEATWKPGDPMEIDPTNPAAGPAAFGSCYMWEPLNCEGTNEYQRPSWRPPAPNSFDIAIPDTDEWWGWNYGDASTIDVRFQQMRGFVATPGHRLNEQTQPRHVTIKEILTGDMILLPNDPTGFDPLGYDPDLSGPGCWFVPRQRDASAQPDNEEVYCQGTDFDKYVDHYQPLPHFQEVYDLQVTNGVLDRLATTAIFAFAAFDGYREDQDTNDPPDQVNWGPDKLNDTLDGSFPDLAPRTGTCAEDTNNCDCDGDGIDSGEKCYDLGIWRVVTPDDLEIPTSMLSPLSAFTQIAINDTGYLNENGGNSHDLRARARDSRDRAYLGATFPRDFDKYVDDYELGRHPIARATPLAAAMHDTREFFSQVRKDNHFFEEDPFAACRPKHVIVLTDGKPEPEFGDPDTLNPAFGYYEDRYPYNTTEEEISAMITDTNLEPAGAAWDDDDRSRYGLRVHVVGINVDNDLDAIEKMANMAIEGRSCAEALVPDSRIPEPEGDCVPGNGCLVDQSAYTGSYDYEYWDPAANGGDGARVSVSCEKYPALILDNNSPDILATALFEMFSEVVASGGLASRTRLVVTNRTDDENIRGQYRFYSGLEVGGGSWWRGIVNRNTISCDPSDDIAELSFDQEIGLQVDLTTNANRDSRRIFTSLPHTRQWCFSCGGYPEPVSDYATNAPRDGDRYFFSFDLENFSGLEADDEFQGTYFTGSVNDSELLGTRIPFEYDRLDAGLSSPYDYFNATSDSELLEVINTYRARIPERVANAQGGNSDNPRVLDGILNSNPVVVTPPNLDLPIGSYRDFRSLYADRPTMMYFSSMEGLLHAVHTGTLDQRVRVRGLTEENTPAALDTVGSAAEQREAWAYMPNLLWKELGNNQLSQPYLVDGTPVVKDVRLCNSNPDKNQNAQACRLLCEDANNCTVPTDQQWRTVLVQGRGEAGSGYYAMDVTRPGGFFPNAAGDKVKNPDPVVLWEFDRNWERAQVEWLYDNYPERISGPTPEDDDLFDNSRCDANAGDSETEDNDDDSAYSREANFWRSSHLGKSVSEVEIATLIVEGDQRPVAIFGGGSSIAEDTQCGAETNGMAIYVVDLQTGSLLRRFTHFVDGGSDVYFGDMGNSNCSNDNDCFPAQFTGSPAVYDSSVGSVGTRGFIGDGHGRLFRMNFLSPNPDEWSVSLFFDPYNDGDVSAFLNDGSVGLGGVDRWGPASYKPVTALNRDRDVMVVYGLGERGDSVTNGQGQAVIALTEDRSDFTSAIANWAEVFPEGEKVTGEPIVFDANVYFPTYQLPDADVCEPGTAKIWGLRLFDDDGSSSLETVGIWTALTNGGGIIVDPNDKWWGPENQPVLIRGLTVTLGPACSLDTTDPNAPTFSSKDRGRPQLVAQTGSTLTTPGTNQDSSTTSPLADDQQIGRIMQEIEPPDSEGLPLSWSVLD